tara:strand:- start:72 stop:329 length:258 start_codon:yes stop_codon:yes gene_type:complete
VERVDRNYYYLSSYLYVGGIFMRIGSLVKTKFIIEIGHNGMIVGKIEKGATGLIVQKRKRKEVYIRFNSGEEWWLTTDELEILSN